MSGIIVGLDIGSAFIRVAIGELDFDNNIRIIGVAKSPSKGVNNGVIINSSAVEACVKEALGAAEQMAGVDVSYVYVSIGGSQVSSINSSGQIGIDPSSRNRRMDVGENAKKRAIDAAEAINYPLEKQKLHTIPREWIVDGISYKNEHIKDLIGTEGVQKNRRHNHALGLPEKWPYPKDACRRCCHLAPRRHGAWFNPY